MFQGNIQEWAICNGQEIVSFHLQLFSTNVFYFHHYKLLSNVKGMAKPNPHKVTTQKKSTPWPNLELNQCGECFLGDFST